MSEKQAIAEKLAHTHVKTPPAVLYPLLLRVWQLMFNKKLGIHFTYKAHPNQDKGPYILISNHASRVDYLYTAPAVLPHRLNYVVGYNEFFRSHLHFIFSLMQVIPKRNFTPDTHTIREIKRVIKNGGHVCIMPEGMSSITGRCQPCAIGSGKLIKTLGVPVYYTKISGGYMTNTKHCLDERPGKVEVVVDQMFTPQQLSEMAADEIQDTMNRLLAHDDYIWNKTARVKFDGHGELAKNLHDLLYMCPRCGKLYTTNGVGNVIKCTNCGNGAAVNEYYDLIKLDDTCVIPDTITQWCELERDKARQDVQDPDFSFSEHVKIGVLPKYEMLKNQETSIIAGEGVLSISHSGLTYNGTRDGQPFSFTLPTAAVPTFGMCTDITRFYTFYKGEFFEFFPERNDTMRWFHITEEMHRVCGGRWQAVPYTHTP